MVSRLLCGEGTLWDWAAFNSTQTSMCFRWELGTAQQHLLDDPQLIFKSPQISQHTSRGSPDGRSSVNPEQCFLYSLDR